MNYLKEQNRILNEQYYGKNPLTLDMEKQFTEIIKILKTDQNESFLKEFKPMSPEIIRQIEPYKEKIKSDIIELFNFKDVTLEIINNGNTNAFTWTTSAIPTIVWAAKERGKYGIRFKNKERYMVIFINAELLVANGATPGTATAVLLHEIGHNFYYENNLLYYTAKVLNLYDIYKIATCQIMIEKFKNNIPIDLMSTKLEAIGATIKVTLAGTQKGAAFLTKLSNFVNTDKTTSSILKSMYGTAKIVYETYDTVDYLIFKVKNYSKSLENIWYNRILSIFENPIKIPIKLSNKRDEMFADNFATSYGYGPEMAELHSNVYSKNYGDTLMNKISNMNKLTAIFMDVLIGVNKLIPNIFEEHGSDVSRMMDQVKYLEDNLKNEAYNDKQKKAIENDLSDVKKTLSELDKYTKMDGDMVKQGKILAATAIQIDLMSKGGLTNYMSGTTFDSKGNWKNMV